MHQFLLYSSFFCAFLALFFSLYAGARVGKFIASTKDLDWDAVANMTGDLATTKKTIQTLIVTGKQKLMHIDTLCNKM